MATRYWVAGGSGIWNSTDTNNWAATSGGASGATVPGTADDVFFDANSGAGTVNKAATGLTIGSLDMTGSTATIDWNSRTLTLSAGGANTNCVLVAAKCLDALSLTFTGTVDQTLTSGGFTLTDIIRGGASGTTQKLTFQDAISMGGTITLNRAKLDFNNFNVTCTGFTSNNSTTRELLMGTGTFTCNGTWETSTTTNLTVTISTSTIASNTQLVLNSGSGFTFPPIVCTSSGLGGGYTFNTAAALTSLTIVHAQAANLAITISAALTVNGLFSVVMDHETAAARTFKTVVGGVAQTVTASGGFWNRGAFTTFQDITAAGITPWIVRDASVNTSNNTNCVFSGHSKSTDMALMGVGM